MLVVAGVLLGVVILFALLGFHTGPHSHALAGVVGFVAAIWLIVMALTGRSSAVLWSLFSADLVLSAGAGTLAWRGLSAKGRASAHRALRIEGAEGVAVSDLTPEGIVRVNGEQWSATSLNGTVRAGSPVQVIGQRGVHIEVWGEEQLEQKGFAT